ncbi:protein tipD isoform X1 [Salvia hispanica]|uniref:protein tipD isoform X1 n=2 Tax=Salvia hispanica TaxID=49212 RepID=UPI0020091105|nr:protein tipD isoform X1 [Salvia hispanica]XP_047952247.1 protein tipD isoform X1 [Salvia hispanica]XP_047952248.1 protein tipD isoform X1 [Salvia hispanica]
MDGYPLLKKPKIEPQETAQKLGQDEEDEENNDEEMKERIRNEQEEAIVALIEHRTREVDHLRQRITYYNAQLEEAERKLEDTQNKLARHRGQKTSNASKQLTNGRKELDVERSKSPMTVPESSQKQSQRQDDVKASGDNLNVTRRPSSPPYRNEGSSPDQTRSRPQILIPSVAPNISQRKTKESANKHPSNSALPTPTLVNTPAKSKGEKASKISSELDSTTQPKSTKRKHEETELKDLIKLIGKSSSPVTVRCQHGTLLPSQHKRKQRTLVLCPTNDQLFATSALDGVVNLWQVQNRGSSASLLSSTDCLSDKQRRWPEDIAWHPLGLKLFSVYSADGGDSQISILNLNKGKERTRVHFLEDKPHSKGIINSIAFMPWDDKLFVTGGSDHGVVLWTEKAEEDSWTPKTLHKSFHSSAVMGIAGMKQKKIVMSVGVDKRIIGYDVTTSRADYKHQIESKCMSVLPNPCDFNLFMVQTGTPERQLRLFDIRLRQMEIHAFGWSQERSDSQSALVNQAWSPDGLYITSGSADPVIHVFDIRYNARKPSQSIRAHHKRVFKAAWHHTLPLLISISSDLNVGLHKII